MGYARESVALGNCPSVRRHLTTGLTVASAGILAVGLVVAPPDVRGARTEVRQVQLTTLALSTLALLGALEKLIGTRADPVVPVAQAAGSAAADIPASDLNTPTASVTTPSTFDAATDPAPKPQGGDAAAGAPTTAALAIPAPLLAAIPQPILAIVGIALLFGPIILLVILACPPCALFNFLTFTIPSLFIPFAPLSAVDGASTALAEPNATIAPTLASDPELSDSAPAAMPMAGAADEARPGRTGKPDAPAPMTSLEPASENEQLPTDTATVTTREPSASASTSEPKEPTVRRVTPRTAVRDSLGVGEQPRDLPHRAKVGHPTTGTAGDGAATVAESSPGGKKTSGAESAGGDSDDS